MSGVDTRWRERCAHYFSSMEDVTRGTDGNKSKKYKHSDAYEANDPLADGTKSCYSSPSKYHRYHKTTFSKKMQPCKGAVKWLSGLDLHGTSMLPRSRSYLYFMFWIATCLLAFVLFGVFLYLLIDNYFESSSHFKTTLSSEQDNASPLTLAVCNSNLLRKSALVFGTRFVTINTLRASDFTNSSRSQQIIPVTNIREVIRNTKLSTFIDSHGYDKHSNRIFADLQKEFTTLYNGMQSDSDWLYVAQSAQLVNFDPFPRALRLTAAEMEDFGHRMDLEILQCTKNGRPCEDGEVSYSQDRLLGNCATFRLSLEQSLFDALTLTVDVEPEEYIDHVSPAPGVRAFVYTSPSSSLSSSTHQSFQAPAGSGIDLKLTKVKEIRRLSRNCNSESDYSRQNCLSRCLNLLTVELCGCSIELENPLSQRCHVNLQYEFVCQRFLEILDRKGLLPCECQHHCVEDDILVTPSVYAWFDQRSEEFLRASLVGSGVTKNFSNLRKSLVKLRVTSLDTRYLVMKEHEEITMVELLLQIGAMSALTVGVSVVTGIELLWLLGKSIITICCSVMKNRDEDQVQELKPYDTQPYFHDLGINWCGYSGDGAVGCGPGYTIDSPDLYQKDRARRYVVSGNQGHTPISQRDSDWIPHRGREQQGFQANVYAHYDRDFTHDSNVYHPYDFRRLNPIVEDRGRVRIEDRDAYDDTNDFHNEHHYRNDDDDEDNDDGDQDLFAHPWERSGDSRAHSRVLVSTHQNRADDVPVPHAPNTSLTDRIRGGPDARKHHRTDGLKIIPFSPGALMFPSSLTDTDKEAEGQDDDQKKETKQQDPFNNQIDNAISHPVDEVNNKPNDETNNQSQPMPNRSQSNANTNSPPIFTISTGKQRESTRGIPNKVTTQAVLTTSGNEDALTNNKLTRPSKEELQDENDSDFHRSRRMRGIGSSQGGQRYTRKDAWKPAGETAPVRRHVGNLARSKEPQPNTWHLSQRPDEFPSAYLPSAYDAHGRIAAYKPQPSYYIYQGGRDIQETAEYPNFYFY